MITFKRDVPLVDIVSTRMLGQYGFLARVFEVFAQLHVSVDMVATSEVSVSLTLDRDCPHKQIIKTLEPIANVNIRTGKTIITLIGNIENSSEILEMTFDVLMDKHISVEMISQGASKVNISFIIDDAHFTPCIQGLHKAFFEGGTV